MSDIVTHYQQQALDDVSPTPWLARLQENARADFERLGFPTRRHEEWKYTALDAFLKQRFAIGGVTEYEPPASDIPVGLKIHLYNGKVINAESLRSDLPAGVIVEPITQALLKHADKLEHYLGHILPHEHAFQALNTAMLQSGLLVYIPEGVQLHEPLVFIHRQDQDNQAVYTRHVVLAQAGSRVTVIEDYQGADDCTYFTNTMTEIYAASKAHVTHYKIQRESKQAYHIAHLATLQDHGSEVSSHSLSLGGKLVRSDVSMRLREPFARGLLNGIYAPGHGQHIDHHTVVYHDVPDCESDQDYKGIMAGGSRAVFNGKVIVAKDAQHTAAKQQNKNLLLAENAEVDTKPQLEIYADDVVCTHGATVGQLDEEALFYFATRGIDTPEASQYLIQAFTAENLARIEDQKLSKWMGQLITQVTQQ